MALWSMNGFTIGKILEASRVPQDLEVGAIADFNNTTTDMLFQDPTTGYAVIWYMSGAIRRGTEVLPKVPGNWVISGAADFDGDVLSDAVLRNRATGANAVWTITAGQQRAILDLPALPDTSWTLAGTADLTGDGNADILWRNSVTGANAVWVMTGTSLDRIVDLPGLPDTAFDVGAVVDLDDDARPDIIWHNRETGANAVWRMDDLRILSVIDLPGIPEGWELVGPR
jgi:hypothetical protein